MPLFNCAGGNGGGGGGTSDYEQLSNLPQVNNNILIGNKSASDLGLVGAVAGKGLSTNDYTNTDKAIVDGVTSALAGKVDTSLVGSSNGVAELDSNGKVPSSQLPSYVDDVLEYADLAHFPATGETGKIYIADDTNKTYRWSGSGFVEISESLALGETSSTAYAGNKGKANADAIAGIKNGTSINSFGAVETALAGVVDSLAEVVYASANVGGDYTSETEYTLNSFTIVDSGTYLIIGKQYLTPDTNYNYVRPILKIYKNNSLIAQKVSAIKQGIDVTSVIHCNSNDVVSLVLKCNNNVSNLNTDNTASELRIVKLSNK